MQMQKREIRAVDLPDLRVARRKVAFLVFPGCQILDLAGPTSVLDSANRSMPQHIGYDVSVVSTCENTVQSSGALEIQPNISIYKLDIRGLDTIFVVGGQPGTSMVEHDLKLRELLRGVHEANTRIVSICTGATILAAAGILDGKKCTTHWSEVEKLQRKYPATEVVDDRIFVESGGVWTSAGVTTGIDMTLAIVARDYGVSIAQQVARDLVLYMVRTGKQKQISDFMQLPNTSKQKLQELMHRIKTQPRANLKVADMAAFCNMSTRNFVRNFKNEFSVTPAAAVRRARVDTAVYFLRDPSNGLRWIAHHSGFTNPDVLRKSLIAEYGMTPAELRLSLGGGADPE